MKYLIVNTFAHSITNDLSINFDDDILITSKMLEIILQKEEKNLFIMSS